MTLAPTVSRELRCQVQANRAVLRGHLLLPSTVQVLHIGRLAMGGEEISSRGLCFLRDHKMDGFMAGNGNQINGQWRTELKDEQKMSGG